MKKYLLSAALLFTVTVGAMAQSSTFGIKGGVNFSKVNADNLNSSTVSGYQAGLFARFGGALYVQPELYVSSTGGKFQSTDGLYNGDVKFTNLNVPLLLGTKIGSNSLNFRLMVGPVYSYTMSKSQNFSANFVSAYQDFGKYNNSTLGFQAGGGVDVGPITADLRYEGGLTDVNKNFGQRQNLWALSVGFKFL
ncbi:MAG: porin family protein [Mucilaginibacter sp.]